MRAILELARKDLVLLMRDRAAAFFTFVFPLAIALFFGYVFGGTTSEPVKVAAWVERPTPATERLVRALGEDGAFVLELVPDRDAGEQLVRRGRAVALVTVPGGYDEELSRTFTGGGARVGLVLDPSRRAEGAMLVGKLHEVAFRTVFEGMSDPAQLEPMLQSIEARLKEPGSGLSMTDQVAIRAMLARARSSAKPRGDSTAPAAGTDASVGLAAWRPVVVERSELPMRPGIPANAFAISFMQGITWALFGAVLTFGSGIAEERQRGTLVRLLVSPLRLGEVLAGKAAACFVACLAAQALLYGTGIAFFGVRVAGWQWAALAMVTTSFAFSGLMALMAAAFRTQGGAQGAGRALLLVLTMVGGGTIPVAFMPPFLRTMSDISPFKWAVLAAEGATWRAWGAAEMWLPLVVLVAIGVAGLLTGAAVVHRTARRA
jgi:ABC-2 type transport system permease protein